jgi:hypothetical protein
VLFRFKSPTLHYASSGFSTADAFWLRVAAGDTAGAAAVEPPGQVATAAAAGLVATWLTIGACVWLAPRRPHPFVIGLGLSAPLRYVPLLLILASGRRSSGTDAGHVQAPVHVPDIALYVVGLACAAAGWWMLLRTVPAEDRRLRIWGLVAGVVAGGVLYGTLLGPRLLP